MNIKLLFVFMLLSIGIQAQSSLRQANLNLNRSKLALQGYDPVAYFTKNKAIKGISSINYSHDGVKYYFSSTENKSLFQKDPSKYEAEYGGWCAYAMGKDGSKVSIDPGTFKTKSQTL
jgi:YHS domain-containing protein